VTGYREAGFGLEQFGLDRTRDALGDLVLNGEGVGHLQIVALRPEVMAVDGIDQLRRYPKLRRGVADTPFQHIARAELACDLSNVGQSVLQREARIACRDAKPAEARKRDDDVFSDPIGEVLPVAAVAGQAER